MKVRQVLERLEVVPTKRKGQNFLLNAETARTIVDFAALGEQQAVIEIGPGLGALTEQILSHTENVAVIEIEKKFCDFLQEHFSKIKLINNSSFLDANIESISSRLTAEKVYLVSNVPYSISSELFIWLIKNRKYFSDASLLFQREFAERLAAKPSSKEYGSLSVMCETYTDYKLGNIISGASFFPSAEVESRLIKLKIYEKPKIEIYDEILFEQLVRAAFSHRRKTIYNSLKSSNLAYQVEDIKKCLELSQIELSRRAETLTAKDYANLTAAFKNII